MWDKSIQLLESDNDALCSLIPSGVGADISATDCQADRLELWQAGQRQASSSSTSNARGKKDQLRWRRLSGKADLAATQSALARTQQPVSGLLDATTHHDKHT